MIRRFILGLVAALALVPTAYAAPDKPLVIVGGQQKQLPAGDTLQANAATPGGASINLPHGTAPSAPVNGDCWTTTAGLYCRINGSTVGPYGIGTGSGTVTSVSVASANGFAGSVATASTTPSITLSTSITGLIKGNGTALSAASAGTDYYNPGGTDVAVADGGTGSSTAAGARTNLGSTTIGDNLFTLANPGAVTFPRFNADNTVTARSAANLRTDLSLVPGTDVQAYDAELAALAGLTSAADKIPYFTGSGTAALTTCGTSCRSALGSLSGTNTGDQTSVTGNAGTATALATGRTIAMTGDVTWTSPSFDGTGNVTAAGTIASGAVSLSKMANLAANSIIGNNTGSSATPIALTSTQVKTLLGLGTIATASTTDYRPEGMHYPLALPSGTDFTPTINGGGEGSVSIGYTGDRLDVALFWPIRTVTVTSLALDVQTAGAGGSVAKIVIYADNGSTAPGTLSANSTDLATDSTGIKTWTPGSPITFTAGVKYWIGFHTSGTPSLSTINTRACATLGYDKTNRTQYVTYRLSSATYGSGPPNPFGTGTKVAANCPAVIMTVQ